MIETINVSLKESNPTPTLSSGVNKSKSESEKGEDLGLKQVNWIRRTKLRTDGTRTDVYYYEDSNNVRLRFLNDVQKKDWALYRCNANIDLMLTLARVHTFSSEENPSTLPKIQAPF